MAGRLQRHELEAIIRSAAMAPLPPETVRVVLDDHRELLAEWAEVEALVVRLMPVWHELRGIMNELAARVES